MSSKMEEKKKITDSAYYYLTVKQIDDACKKHPYILARFASGHQIGINSKDAAMARQRQRYNDNALTQFIGVMPCDFNTYITFCGFVSVILPCRYFKPYINFIGKIIAPNRC